MKTDSKHVRCLPWSPVLSVLLLTLTLSAGVPAVRAADEVKATDFSLENIIDGKTVTLGACGNKSYLLEFGSRYCKPCMEMVPDLVKLYENYKSSGLMILKIDIDSEPDKQAMKCFAADKKMTFPYLVGNREIARQYGVILLPTLYLINKDKKVVKKYIGYQTYSVLEHDIKTLK
jgi:thiol-disulfide isomerase/thioredoxin